VIYKEILFKNRIPLMSSAMDTYALRERTIARNIANISTPGYKPQSVKFEELFQQARSVTKLSVSEENQLGTSLTKSAIPEGEVANQEIPVAQINYSGDNSVNIDREMSELAQNQIRYRFTARMMKNYFNGLQSAITGTQK
jgi:flagellar basal-body rod protein FlgB